MYGGRDGDLSWHSRTNSTQSHTHMYVRMYVYDVYSELRTPP